jgi:hypothetical protein
MMILTMAILMAIGRVGRQKQREDRRGRSRKHHPRRRRRDRRREGGGRVVAPSSTGSRPRSSLVADAGGKRRRRRGLAVVLVATVSVGSSPRGKDHCTFGLRPITLSIVSCWAMVIPHILILIPPIHRVVAFPFFLFSKGERVDFKDRRSQ